MLRAFLNFLVPILILAFTALSSYCIRFDDTEKSQSQMHRTFLLKLENIFKDIESVIQKSAHDLQADYPKDIASCAQKKMESAKSSLYMAPSRSKKPFLNCLIEATTNLEGLWANYYSSHDYLSWIYLYDNNAKFVRILPKTDMQAMFYDDPRFDLFNFFQIAVRHYPKGAWSPTVFDVSGTGRILMYSVAVKLPKMKEFTVVGADMRMTQVLRDEEPMFLAFARKHEIKSLFVYGYHSGLGKGTAAFDYSTNPAAWRVLKPYSGSMLHITPEEKGPYFELEEKARSHPLEVQSKFFRLGEGNHFCSLTYEPPLDLFTLVCNSR